MSPDQTERVASKSDLVAFVRLLIDDARANGATWENATLESFLGALHAWLEDADGYYANRGELLSAQSPWRVARGGSRVRVVRGSGGPRSPKRGTQPQGLRRGD